MYIKPRLGKLVIHLFSTIVRPKRKQAVPKNTDVLGLENITVRDEESRIQTMRPEISYGNLVLCTRRKVTVGCIPTNLGMKLMKTSKTNGNIDTERDSIVLLYLFHL